VDATDRALAEPVGTQGGVELLDVDRAEPLDSDGPDVRGDVLGDASAGLAAPGDQPGDLSTIECSTSCSTVRPDVGMVRPVSTSATSFASSVSGLPRAALGVEARGPSDRRACACL
jgi:hypothetical protein